MGNDSAGETAREGTGDGSLELHLNGAFPLSIRGILCPAGGALPGVLGVQHPQEGLA